MSPTSSHFYLLSKIFHLKGLKPLRLQYSVQAQTHDQCFFSSATTPTILFICTVQAQAHDKRFFSSATTSTILFICIPQLQACQRRDLPYLL